MTSRCPVLRWVDSAPEPAAAVRWLITHEVEGVPFLRVGRTESHYLVVSPGLADFWVAASGESAQAILLEPSQRARAEEVFEQLVVPGFDQLRGTPAIHASAVRTPAGVIAFLGPSGAGKSTMAGLLSAKWELVADDYLPLIVAEPAVLAVPSSTWVRVRSPIAEHLGGEQRERAGKLAVERPSANGAAPLVRIYALRSEEQVALEPCSRRDALLVVASQLHRLDTATPGLLEAELGFIEQLVSRVPVQVLSYPRQVEVTPEIVRLISQDLQLPQGSP